MEVTCNDKPGGWPGIIHGHSQIYFPFGSGNLHGPDKCGSVAGNGHGPSDPPGEHKHWIPECMVINGDKIRKNIYQGTNAVITPNTSIVTDEPQIATFRPNLSETSPEQKDPRTNPGTYVIAN